MLGDMNAATKTARLAVLASYLVSLNSDIALADEMLSTYAGLAWQGADVRANVQWTGLRSATPYGSTSAATAWGVGTRAGTRFWQARRLSFENSPRTTMDYIEPHDDCRDNDSP